MTPSVERLRCAFDQSSSTHPSQRTLMAWLTSNETARGFLRASSTKPCWRFQRRSSRTGGDTAKSLGSPIAVVCSTYSTCSHNPTPGSFPTYSPYTRQRLSGSSGLPMKARPPWSVSHTVYFRFFSIVSLTRVLPPETDLGAGRRGVGLVRRALHPDGLQRQRGPQTQLARFRRSDRGPPGSRSSAGLRERPRRIRGCQHGTRPPSLTHVLDDRLHEDSQRAPPRTRLSWPRLVVGVLLRAFELRLIASQPEPIDLDQLTCRQAHAPQRPYQDRPFVSPHPRALQRAVSSAQLDQEPAFPVVLHAESSLAGQPP